MGSVYRYWSLPVTPYQVYLNSEDIQLTTEQSVLMTTCIQRPPFDVTSDLNHYLVFQCR